MGKKIRQTSLAAYRDIVDSGVLGQRQLQVYQVLYNKGRSMTISEVFDYLEKQGHLINWNSRTRFTELRKSGAIREARKRHCKITGRVVLTWEVTGDMPAPTTVETDKRTKAELIAALKTKHEVAIELRTKLAKCRQSRRRLLNKLQRKG